MGTNDKLIADILSAAAKQGFKVQRSSRTFVARKLSDGMSKTEVVKALLKLQATLARVNAAPKTAWDRDPYITG